MDTTDALDEATREYDHSSGKSSSLPAIGPTAGATGRKPRGRPPGQKNRRGAFSESQYRHVAVEKPVATPAAEAKEKERAVARRLLEDIGLRFVRNRKKSKSLAFETYQSDLAKNMSTLVMGQAVSMKEITVLIMDLEGSIKANTKQSETPHDVVAQWLRGELFGEEDE